MSAISKLAALSLIAAAILFFCGSGALLRAQEYGTRPGAIPDPSTYQGSMELQRQEQEQQRQYQQQQQPQQPSYQGQQGPGYAPYRGTVTSPADPWRRRPPLTPAKNPLLGRWHPTGADSSDASGAAGELGALFGPDFANAAKNLAGGVLQGGCDSMFGRGVIEFRPDTLVAISRDGSPSVLNHVQYRGDGKAVAVLPTDPGSVDVMVFDFKGDRITARVLGCAMERVRGGATASASTPASVTRPAPNASTPVSVPARAATLSLAAGVTPATGNMIAMNDAQIFLQKRAVEASLSDAGFSEAGRSPVATWFLACKAKADACRAGVRAMMANPVAMMKTDANGQLTMPPVPPGHYYLFAFVNIRGRALLWNVPVDLHPGANSLVLDQHNAIAPPS